MIEFKLLEPSDLIAIAAMMASAFSALYAWRAVRAARRQFLEAEQRECEHFARVEARESITQIAANYLALETCSSEIFRYTADNETLIAPLRGETGAEVWNAPEHADARAVLTNLYFQSLNLFEVCARYRRHDMVRAEVFASWIAWMIELLEDRYFREIWQPMLRINYTSDVRDIFDVGVQIFAEDAPEAMRNALLYAAIGEIMGCDKISGWLDEALKEKKWTELNSYRMYRLRGITAPQQQPTPQPLPVA